jgi:hypothetical protein
MASKLTLAGAAAVLVAGTANAATTSFVIAGHDADNPATTVFGGANGGTSHVTAEGGADYTITFGQPPLAVSQPDGRRRVVVHVVPRRLHLYHRRQLFGPLNLHGLLPRRRVHGTCASDRLRLRQARDSGDRGGVAYAIANAGDQRFNGDGVGDGCYDGIVCTLNEPYTADLFLDNSTTGGATGGSGNALTYSLFLPLDLNLQGNFPGDGVSHYTLSIDPVVILNPAFFAANGIDTSIARLTFEPAIGNAASATPEPDTWALMVAGFGLVGAIARGRKPAKA